MLRPRGIVLVVAVAVCLPVAVVFAQAGRGQVAEVIVERVAPGSAAERAGLRSGDVLVGWRREANPPANPDPARGSVQSPFDLVEVEVEQAPRGLVTLEGQRQGRSATWRVPPGAWGLTAQVMLSGALGEALQQADRLRKAKKPQEAVAAYREVALQAKDRVGRPILAWLRLVEVVSAVAAGAGESSDAAAVVSLLETDGRRDLAAQVATDLGLLLAAGGRDASVILQHALTRLGPAPPPSLMAARTLSNLGSATKARGGLAAAEDFYRRSLAMKQELAPGSLDVAGSLSNLGLITQDRGDLATAEDLHRGALAIAEKLAPGSLEVAASLNNLGMLANSRGDLGGAEDLLRRSLAIKEKLAPESLDVASSLSNLGGVALRRGDLPAAEHLLRRSLAIQEKRGPGSLDIASSLNNLGGVAQRRGDLIAAEDLFRRSLAIRQERVPGSLDVAMSLNNLGLAADSRGDVASAEDFHRRSLALREKLLPGSLDVAASLTNLGNLAASRGDLAVAEGFYRRSVAIMEKLAPGSLDVASNLNNLGNVARDRGDLAAADGFHRRSLVIREKLAPGGLDVAMSLNNLGNVAQTRGDLTAATDFYRRSLAIMLRLVPESLGVAASLDNLGSAAQSRGDLPAAEVAHRLSLEIGQKLAPGSLSVAMSLGNLANVAQRRGDLAAAEDFYRRSLAIMEKLAPGSLDVAASLSNLGSVAMGRGDLAGAEDLYGRSLAITEKLAPRTQDVAKSLYGLGLAARLRGDKTSARSHFCGAVDALESQRARLGGTQEARSGFMAGYASYYRDCQDALLDLGKPEEALQVLERSRARSLLEMLAERDVLFTLDLPADLARERRLIDAEYDRTQARLGKLVPSRDGPEIERLRTQLRELRQKQDEIAARIKQVSPRLGSLQYPTPLDLRSIRSALDPGTLLLAFSVGAEHTTLFAVQPIGEGGGTGLSVFTIPAGENRLREKVEAFRNLIRRGAPVRGLGSELYGLLLKPAGGLIAGSRRLLISPDGPLHVLPFAALTHSGQGAPSEYLVQWKPLHFTVSATVYAELKKDRKQGPSGPAKVVAFGDPKYPSIRAGTSAVDASAEVRNLELRSVLARGMEFQPLPGTRQEVEEIAGLYPKQAVTYLGAEATEGRAKGLGKDARYVHFACHGFLDERFPLNSALALTLPEAPGEGEENGLLQAWEVFERVRLDADLVSLSACETGLGKETGGEGLVGLTRAFQYAGARSVLASLWSVSDESTVGLMKGFYGGLKSGKGKDEALREAQLRLLKDEKTAHPFHWAAFQITGDWK